MASEHPLSTEYQIVVQEFQDIKCSKKRNFEQMQTLTEKALELLRKQQHALVNEQTAKRHWRAENQRLNQHIKNLEEVMDA